MATQNTENFRIKTFPHLQAHVMCIILQMAADSIFGFLAQSCMEPQT